MDVGTSIFGDVNVDIVHGCLDAILTNRVGQGHSRTVYAIGIDGREVMKVEHSDNGSSIFQNIVEWSVWNDFKGVEECSVWLAGCMRISGNGKALVQEALEIITDTNDPRLPLKIPSFLTDTKVCNWGVDKKGNVKCCDYGIILLMHDNPWKLKKAQWS